METRIISELTGWDKNPRNINDKDYQRLKDQITLLGQYKPLLITDENIVIGGNMRLRVLRELGVGKVWVTPINFIERDNLWYSVINGEEQKKPFTSKLQGMTEYALSDNDRAGYYSQDMLANLLGEVDIDLDAYAIDLTEPMTLDEMLNGKNEEVKEDEAPPVDETQTVSELGKVYQLGRHRLMCGDATKIEDVEKLMGGQKADMVFTDPPYGMFLNADFSGMKNSLDFAKDKGFVGGRKYDNVIGDHQDFNPDFINTIFAMFPDTKEVFLWGANYYSELLQNRNDGNWFVWDKRLDESADKMYGSCFELCWSKSKHKQDIVRIKWAGVFGTEQEFDHKRHHPTQKPVELSAWFVDKFSQPDHRVIDLFGGSGSTLIACEQTNRQCYMMELDPMYVDVIRKRYAKFIDQESQWQEITPEIV